ncbi:MAG: phosphoglucosamine mutase [Acidobacteriota bacterium]|nr:phosphoglucosamine mutase [Acidobacteriota bacterium]
MTKLFGTDGMRGEAGKFPLDAATVETIGASLAAHLKDGIGRLPVIVIGRDTRESGEWLERALVAGASRVGAQLKSAGVITTPGVAFLARVLPADAGIVISASHNAFRDNGIKIFSPSGRKLDEAMERQIENDVLSGANGASPASESAPDVGAGDEGVALRSRYLDHLENEIGSGLALDKLRLVVDCANGAASAFAPELFERLGASVKSINDNPDGRNINFNCGSLHMERLQDEVVKWKADIGVAVDGDADRALFVDSEGRLVNGDGYLWVLAKHLQSKGELHDDTVVATVMSNVGLEIALRSRGIRLVRTDVGDKYVLDEMLRLGASLGGEQSGHIIFPQVSLAGDGLVTTLRLLRAMKEEDKPLQELFAGFQSLPQILVNVEVKEKRPFSEVPPIQNATQNIVNKLGSRGRLLLRYSGTEPLARVMLEGENQAEIEKVANELANVIRETLGG